MSKSLVKSGVDSFNVPLFIFEASGTSVHVIEPRSGVAPPVATTCIVKVCPWFRVSSEIHEVKPLLVIVSAEVFASK